MAHQTTPRVREDYGALLASRQSELRNSLGKILAAHPTILWEVGCGHGHFLTAFAEAHPSVGCVGIDLVGERIERANRKRDRAKLTNLHFLRTEARLFLDTLPTTRCISSVFALFPDPWPKSRHHKHRVLQPEFLATLATRVTADCRLHFRTDYRPYFEETRAFIMASTHWQPLDVPWPFEFETVFQRRAESHDSLIAGMKIPGS